jgi:hypothetical protein
LHLPAHRRPLLLETLVTVLRSYAQHEGVWIEQMVTPESSLCPNCNAALPDVVVPDVCPGCRNPMDSALRPLVTVGKGATPVSGAHSDLFALTLSGGTVR